MEIVAALISAITSIIVIILSRLFFERKFLIFKLQYEYQYDQKKKIKEIISKHKIKIIQVCYKIMTTFYHIENQYNKRTGEHNYIEKRDIHNVVYRLCAILGQINLFQKEIVFFDTTIAEKMDMSFIKYTECFFSVISDKYYIERNCSFKKKSNIRKSDLEYFSSLILNEEETDIIDTLQFKSIIETRDDNDFKKLYDYFQSIEFFDEDDHKLDRLFLYHLLIICFLNSFGYDYQKTGYEEQKRLILNTQNGLLLSNFVDLFLSIRFKLNNQPEIMTLRDLIHKR